MINVIKVCICASLLDQFDTDVWTRMFEPQTCHSPTLCLMLRSGHRREPTLPAPWYCNVVCPINQPSISVISVPEIVGTNHLHMVVVHGIGVTTCLIFWQMILSVRVCAREYGEVLWP